ncbi:MAG: hypothetical protein ACTSPB_20055 [Candidatus Thorarchaeota archaeon]
MNKKLLGFVLSLVLMFSITYKFWLPNEGRRPGDPEFKAMIMTINSPHIRVTEEEKYVFCYMEDPGDSIYHRSLWMIIPTSNVMQMRALSQQEITDLQQQQQPQSPLQ